MWLFRQSPNPSVYLSWFSSDYSPCCFARRRVLFHFNMPCSNMLHMLVSDHSEGWTGSRAFRRSLSSKVTEFWKKKKKKQVLKKNPIKVANVRCTSGRKDEQLTESLHWGDPKFTTTDYIAFTERLFSWSRRTYQRISTILKLAAESTHFDYLELNWVINVCVCVCVMWKSDFCVG